MHIGRVRLILFLVASLMVFSCSLISTESRESTQPADSPSQRTSSNLNQAGETKPGLWPSEVIPFPKGNDRIIKMEMLEDTDGNFHAVIALENQEEIYLLYLQRSGNDGSKVWKSLEEIYRGKKTSLYDIQLEMVVGENGLLQVAWMHEYDDEVKVVTRAENGVWSQTVSIPPPEIAGRNIQSIVLKFNLSGRLHIVWMGMDKRAQSPIALYASEWTMASGLSSWREIPRPTEETGVMSNGAYPATAMDQDGLIYMAWEYSGSLYYSHTTEQGDWAAVATMGEPCDSSRDLDMVFDAKGTLHVVCSYRESMMYMEKAGDEGFPKMTQVPGINFESRIGQTHRLLIVGGDSLVLIWPSTQEDFPYQYIVKRSDAPWPNAASVVPDTASAGSFAALADANGFIHMIWGTPNDLRYAAESGENLQSFPGSRAEIQPPPFGTVEFLAGSGTYQIGKNNALSIGSQFITWSASNGEEKDVFAYNLATKQEFTVSDDPGDQENPATDGKWILWEDHRNTSPRIYAWDSESRKSYPLTAASSPQWAPDIDKEMIVFRDWRKFGTCSWGDTPMFGPSPSCDWDIWGMDLTTKEEFPIFTAGGPQYAPQISGSWVVWYQSLGGSDWAVFAKETHGDSAPIQLPIGSESATQFYSLHGKLLAYDRQKGKTEPAGIFVLDLSTGRSFPVSIGSLKADPSSHGNLVVWTDWRNGDADIYGYDLASGMEFSICIAAGAQWGAAVSGDAVTWFDNRNGQTEVFAAILPSVNGEQTDSIIPAPMPMPTVEPAPTNSPAPTTTPPPNE